jgi:hypothetical protein
MTQNTYSASDPRSKLAGSAPVAAATPYEADSAAIAAAAAEYVKFHRIEPAESGSTARTWYARGQNFVVAYSEVEAPTAYTRETQHDEYVLLLPEVDTVATVVAAGESKHVRGYSLAIVPPGPGRVEVSRGIVVRVFTSRNADVVAKCSNAAAYAQPHPNIPPFQPWPDPPGGFRIRVYSLDVPPKEGRFGRIWRCTTMMINVLPREGPRDVSKLSPHHHADFEQGSLALDGAFTHHLRWPWGANMHHWRPDDHEVCPAPSIAVIPPPAIHTSAAMESGGNQLVDIFSPPRHDFSKMAGWVLNADDYPLPAP